MTVDREALDRELDTLAGLPLVEALRASVLGIARRHGMADPEVVEYEHPEGGIAWQVNDRAARTPPPEGRKSHGILYVGDRVGYDYGGPVRHGGPHMADVRPVRVCEVHPRLTVVRDDEGWAAPTRHPAAYDRIRPLSDVGA